MAQQVEKPNSDELRAQAQALCGHAQTLDTADERQPYFLRALELETEAIELEAEAIALEPEPGPTSAPHVSEAQNKGGESAVQEAETPLTGDSQKVGSTPT